MEQFTPPLRSLYLNQRTTSKKKFSNSKTHTSVGRFSDLTLTSSLLPTPHPTMGSTDKLLVHPTWIPDTLPPEKEFHETSFFRRPSNDSPVPQLPRRKKSEEKADREATASSSSRT